jgi:hypothetical protein
MGQVYGGKSSLSLISSKKLIYRITVNEHLLLLKTIGNKLAALTGKGTVFIMNL